MGQHNAASPEQAIMPGDRILNVNGKTIPPMIGGEFRKDQVIKICLERAMPAVSNEQKGVSDGWSKQQSDTASPKPAGDNSTVTAPTKVMYTNRREKLVAEDAPKGGL